MQLIDSSAELLALGRKLSGKKTLFLDTEFDSGRGGTDLCLLSLSDGESISLIDALRLKSLEPLAAVLGAADCEWVLHAGQQDVALISAQAGLRERPRVFDTQVAWSLSSVEHSVSLAYLTYRLLGIRGGKAYQADDWKRRPLPAPQLKYAASDVENLPALHATLKKSLRERGREQMVLEASAETIWPTPLPKTSLSLDSFRNAWQLDGHSQAALRYLIGWYNGLDDEGRAQAPEPKTLLAIASRLPETGADLARLKGVPRRFSGELGDRLTGGIMRATASADAGDFEPIEPPPYATAFELRLDGWLGAARADVCAKLEVAPELVLSARVLRAVKAALLEGKNLETAFAGIGGFRMQLLFGPFSEFASRLPPPEPEG